VWKAISCIWMNSRLVSEVKHIEEEYRGKHEAWRKYIEETRREITQRHKTIGQVRGATRGFICKLYSILNAMEQLSLLK
jgi:hypothetical protein